MAFSAPQHAPCRGRVTSGGAVSQNNPIRVFVSHLYAPDDEYLRVFEYLESAPNFFYTNLDNVVRYSQVTRNLIRER